MVTPTLVGIGREGYGTVWNLVRGAVDTYDTGGEYRSGIGWFHEEQERQKKQEEKKAKRPRRRPPTPSRPSVGTSVTIN